LDDFVDDVDVEIVRNKAGPDALMSNPVISAGQRQIAMAKRRWEANWAGRLNG
jgi:hypothetical protein